jgi:hypothetical protein
MSLGIDFLSHEDACLVRDKLNRHFLQSVLSFLFPEDGHLSQSTTLECSA